MMDRIAEAELMEDEEQAKAYALADFSGAHDLFIEKFQEQFPEIDKYFNDIVLDLGCGTCDITRRFALAYPDAGFHAVDGAAAMLKYAVKGNEQANLSPRIKVIQDSLPDIELPQPLYHLIISNSLLHHLHEPSSLWETIQQHAKQYAHVFVMDLIRPIDEATVEFLCDEYVKNESDQLKTDFKHSLRAAFTVDEVRKQLDKAGMKNLTVEPVSDRHMIIYGVLP